MPQGAAHPGLRPRLLTAVPPGRERANDAGTSRPGGREFQRQDGGDSDGVMEDCGGAAGEECQPGDLAVVELAAGGREVQRAASGGRGLRQGPAAQAAAECSPGREARVGGSHAAWESRASGGRS